LTPLDEIKGIHKALKNNGIEAIIMPEEVCCGLPSLLEGDQKGALECMRKNMDIFRKIYTKTLFITCPFCLRMFKSYYPFYLNYKIEMEFRSIGDLFLSMKLISVNTQSKKIAYHTPCLMDIHVSSRHQQMIEKLAGNSYIIIPDRICCGHGFGLPFQDTEISGIICATNLNKILEKGVQVLITDCPSCTMHWIDGVQKINCDLEVIPYWRFIINSSLEN
jgi:glycolate oxidase iron-sulfur subunit